MALEEFIDGLERLIVRILLWIIIIPKTLFKIFTDPDWVLEFFDNENQEKNKEQSDDYISPILLFLICSAVLFLIIDQSDGNGTIDEILKAVQSITGFIIGVIFLSLPLLFAFATEIVRSKKIDGKKLIRSLKIQCYYFSPLTLSVFSIFIINALLPDAILLLSCAILIAACTIIWFLIIEAKMIKQEIGSGLFKSISIMLGCTAFEITAISLIVFTLTASGIDSYGPGGVEKGELILEKDGDYSIIIKGYTDFDYGKYTLLVSDTIVDSNAKETETKSQSPTTQMIQSNETINSEIGSGDKDEWHFSGNQDDLIEIYVAPIESDFDLLFNLLDENGNTINSVDLWSEGDLEELIGFNLPTSGIYSISVEGFEIDDQGSFKIHYYNYNEANNISNNIVENTNVGGFLINQSVSGYLSETDDENRWEFKGKKGDSLIFTVTPEQSFDVVFDVVNNENNSIIKMGFSSWYLGAVGFIYISLVGLAVFLGLRSLWKNRKGKSKYEDESIEDEALLA